MRLRTYTADSMPGAMDQIRADLGPDAIIVASRTQPNGGVEVTAACDDRQNDGGIAATAMSNVTPSPQDGNPQGSAGIERALAAAAIPAPLSAGICAFIDAYGDDDLPSALTDALADIIRFGALPIRPDPRPLVIVGPHGSGKTTTVAKLAATAIMRQQMVDVMSTDIVRPAGVDQLSALANVMDIAVDVGASPTALATAWRARRRARSADGCGALAIIDTPGINPFASGEMDRIEAVAAAVNGRLLLVVPAGIDAVECADLAAAFAEVGAADVIVSRLDAARRFGGALAAGVPGGGVGAPGLCLRGFGTSPSIADGLQPATAASLANVILSGAIALRRTRM